ncbi:MAG: serine/threonine protein kinase [Phycisphaeraceae bacterium]|nr:serine/threonine protein kinase [Phycisphaeraceae bacterium]
MESWSPSMPDHDRLGPYRIIRKLGEGGMGAVFHGIEDGSERPAAIKLLPLSLARQEGFRLRFEIEIETLRKLEHPNIIRLFGFGEEAGQLFYAMEFVEGSSLQDELDRGRRFSWRETAELGLQLCQALRHAHLRGIIHRDIKPANVMLTRDGTAKLADFGIARLYGVSGMTLDGGTIGTANYMAPEQVDGGTVTDRSDLYALGGTFYALLAGQPPFVAKSLMQLFQMQKNQEPAPVTALAPKTPKELEIVIAAMLRKEPAQRIANAMMLAKSLQGVIDAVTLREQQGVENPATAKPMPSSASRQSSGAASSSPASEPITMDKLLAGHAADQPTMASQRKDVEPGANEDITLASAPDMTSASPPGDLDDITLATDTPDTPQELHVAAPPSPSASARAVFITAEEAAEQDRLRQEEEERSRPRIIGTGTIIFVAMLFVVTLAAWWWLKPLSADQLFARIDLLQQMGEDAPLEQAYAMVMSFEERHPDDARMSQIKVFKDDLQLRDLERKLRQTAGSRLANDKSLSPVERICLEALAEMKVSPEAALLKFEAMLTLFNDPGITLDKREERLLEVARRQVEKLREQVKLYGSDHLLKLRLLLARAKQFRESNPARTRQACDALILLYADKPWAQDVVAQAKALRAEVGDATPTTQP